MDQYETSDFPPSMLAGGGPKAPRSLQELLLLRKGGSPSQQVTSEPPLSSHFQQFVAIGEEEEMPSQSVTIPDEVSLFVILNNPMYNSPVKGRKTPSPVKSQEEIIELYSTITLLRQENASLQKDLQAAKNSNAVQLSDMQKSYDEKLRCLQEELNNSQRFVETLQQENQEILKALQEQSVHQSNNSSEASALKSDYSALKADFSSLKIDYNKLKMENTVQANTNAKLNAEISGLNAELGSVHRELEEQIGRSSAEVCALVHGMFFMFSLLECWHRRFYHSHDLIFVDCYLPEGNRRSSPALLETRRRRQ